MPRAVRFEVEPPSTPDPSTPHHTDKGLHPRGILLKPGTFENKSTKTGRFNPRRHSTPVDKISSTMQNITVDDAYHVRQRHMSIDQRYTLYTHSKTHETPKDAHSGQRARFPLVSLPSRTSNTTWRTDDYNQTPSHAYASDIRSRWTPYDQPPISWQGPQTSVLSHYSHTPMSSYEPTKTPFEIDTCQLSLKDVRVHRHLARPDISWNIAVPLSSAIFDMHSKLQLSELDMPATTPAVNKLTIKFDHSLIIEPFKSRWYSIVVRGTCPLPFGGGEIVPAVTIRDVLDALYGFFQVLLTEEEYTTVTPSQAREILDAHHKRTATLPYHGGSMPNLEPIRADILGGYTRFMGVQITSTKRDRLTLGLDLAPAY